MSERLDNLMVRHFNERERERESERERERERERDYIQV